MEAKLKVGAAETAHWRSAAVPPGVNVSENSLPPKDTARTASRPGRKQNGSQAEGRGRRNRERALRDSA